MSRKKVFILAIVAFAILGTLALGNYHRIEKLLERGEGEDDDRATAAGEMMMLWQSSAYPDPTGIQKKYLDAWTYAQQMKRDAENRKEEYGLNGTATTETYNGSWSSLGFSSTIGGRVLSIAMNSKRDNSIFIGTASGGIWKTYNALGGTPVWQSVTTGFPVLGVSSIIINPSDTNTIYAGTGEIYRIDSTNTTMNPSITGYNTWKTRGTWGVGVLKSTNGGTSWSQVLVKSENSLFGIQRLRFDPTNYNTVYAAATDGLYKTTNAGTTWTQVLAKTLVEDVVIDSKAPGKLLISVGNLDNIDKGIYQSLDTGKTWTKITNGTPASIEGCIKFDYVKNSGDTVYASIGVNENGSPDELYQTTNFGTKWTNLTGSNHCSYQFWYSHCVAVNPTNTNLLTYAGVGLHQYTVSSSSASSIGGSVHSDIHDVKYDSSNTSNIFLACDGGVYRSTNGGNAWTAINSGLTAIQFYSTVGVGSLATGSAVVVGGLQDNGVWVYNGSTSTWSSFPNLATTDGASCFVDPTNNANILASGDARLVYYSSNTAGSSAQVLGYWGEIHDSRTAFVAPMAISKSSHTTFYVGTDELFKTTNSGGAWTGGTGGGANPGTSYIDALHKTAIAIAVSPKSANKLYVSVSPFSQFDGDVDSLYYSPPSDVLRSINGGSTLPMTIINGSVSHPLPNRYVQDFAISPTNDDSVWAVIGGFGSGHVYVSPDSGANWYDKDPGPSSGGLPDVPANAIMLDPNNSQIIYVGTDIGTYVSPDGGTTWQDFNGGGFWDGMMVMDLEPYPGNKILAATHGKGAFVSQLYSVSLPVTVTSFTGTNNGNGYANLQWTTSIESSIRQYNLQRSLDGVNFQQVATVQAKNANYSTYNYNDNISSIQNSSEVYYRLQIVNVDGTIQLTNVVAIAINAQLGMSIAGNPFTDQLTIIFTTLAQQQAEARLFDASGRMLMRQAYALQGGSNTLSLQNLGFLPKGMYVLEFVTPGQRYSRKVVKK